MQLQELRRERSHQHRELVAADSMLDAMMEQQRASNQLPATFELVLWSEALRTQEWEPMVREALRQLLGMSCITSISRVRAEHRVAAGGRRHPPQQLALWECRVRFSDSCCPIHVFNACATGALQLQISDGSFDAAYAMVREVRQESEFEDASTVQASSCEARLGLCTDMFTPRAELIVLWRHEAAPLEPISVRASPGRKRLFVSFKIGRGPTSAATSEVHLEYRLRDLAQLMHVHRPEPGVAADYAAALTLLSTRPPLVYRRSVEGELSRCTDLTNGKRLSQCNALQLILRDSTGADALLAALQRCGRLKLNAEQPLFPRLTLRKLKPAADCAEDLRRLDPSVLVGFAPLQKAGDLCNGLCELGLRAGSGTGLAGPLPFDCLYRCEILATHGMLCPSLFWQFLQAVAAAYHGPAAVAIAAAARKGQLMVRPPARPRSTNGRDVRGAVRHVPHAARPPRPILAMRQAAEERRQEDDAEEDSEVTDTGGAPASEAASDAAQAKLRRLAVLQALDLLVGRALSHRGARVADALHQFRRLAAERAAAGLATLEKESRTEPEALPEHLARICRVTVTPTRYLCAPPEIEVANRTLRSVGARASEAFLRVTFTDEDLSRYFARLPGDDATEDLYAHIQTVLNDGLLVAGRKFVFLAFGSSQIKDRGVWMFSPLEGGEDADAMRRKMGHLDAIQNIAKHGARLGLCFSSTVRTVDLAPDQWRHGEADVTNGTAYTFSDGCGRITCSLAAQVWRLYRTATMRDRNQLAALVQSQEEDPVPVPSAFQIRLGGSKGVVVLDPRMGTAAQLVVTRKSMDKFSGSPQRAVEVCDVAKALPCYLNRQAIMILSKVHGVPDSTFLEMQREMLRLLDDSLGNRAAAETVLRGCGGLDPQLTEDVLRVLTAGVSLAEPFLQAIMQVIRQWHHTELVHRARIFVDEGATLLGVMDETGTLRYGEVNRMQSRSHAQGLLRVCYHLPQVFACVATRTRDANMQASLKPIDGDVVVVKFPALHPGDVRTFRAVSVETLEAEGRLKDVEARSWLSAQVNTLVFPQLGRRPHPNELAGSDLDGDQAITHNDLHAIQFTCSKSGILCDI